MVEGQTEESFIKDVLAPALYPRGIYATPTILGVPGHKGGNVNYARVKKDVLLQLKQDQAAYCSTMFDLYRLGSGFPGMPLSNSSSGLDKATRIENAVRDDIASAIPYLRAETRFIPYIQVHEFEGLLFSDINAFTSALRRQDIFLQFKSIRDAFATPEDINDDPNTAPSKRVTKLYPSYRKVIDGVTAARDVGLKSMRRECPHFDSWVTKLESVETLK